MNKKIIAALIVVVVVAVAFFIFRAINKEKENSTLAAEAFEKLTPVAARVPQAGLPQMAAAISQYQAKNGAYPKRLIDLYPDFIPWERFIRDVEWSYQPGGDNFSLRKSVVKGKKRLVASIDKRMVPQVETGVQIAAVKPVPTNKKKTAPVEELTRPVMPLPVVTSYEKKEKEQQVLIERPKVVSVKPGAIRAGISEDLGKRFLVWQDENGVLGFGNVKYPSQHSLSIYDEDSWIQVDYPKPPAVKKSATGVDRHQAQDLGETFLVWKDKNGRSGYGNVTYPDSDSVSARPEDVRVGSKADAGSAASGKGLAAKVPPTTETIAEQYSKNYVVWKDREGNIGFGNVQYPAFADVAFICVEGSWQKVVK